ncbi:MAG: PAS domain S-box protein [Chloroflexi bacterium]|nr:PAS domain S-box protein [Chloroflexota bacterium]
MSLLTQIVQKFGHRQPKKAVYQSPPDWYQGVVQNQTDLICRFRPDLSLTFVNQPYSALFGKRPAQMIGCKMLEGIPIEYHALVIDQLTRLTLAQPLASHENPIRLVDGSLRWFQWTDEIIVDASGQLIEYQSIGRDITDQQQRVQAIEETRHFFQSILDAFSASTAVLSSDGTIIQTNSAWRAFGAANGAWSETNCLGQNYLTVCDSAIGAYAAEAAPAAAGIRAVITGDQPTFYLEYPCFNATENSWFGMNVTPFAEAPPRRVVVAHINITERKQAEDAEREQRRVAEALRDSLAALTSSLDVQSVMRQILNSAAIVVPSEAGCILLFEGNDGRVAYLRGYTPEAEAFFKDYAFPTKSSAGNVISDKQLYFVPDTRTDPTWIALPVSAWVRSSIGIPIEIRGEVMGLLVVDSAIPNHFQPSDIEKLRAFAHYAGLALEKAYQLKQLEQRVLERTTELQAAKEQVETILNNSPDGILLLHTDLRIQQTNVAFNILFACKPADTFGGSLGDLIHLDDLAHVNAIIQTVLLEQTSQRVEIRCYRKNGTLFEAEISISYSAAVATGQAGLVCTIRDITEHKRAQNALAEERNLLRTLIDTIPDAIYVKDLEHRAVLANTGAAHSFGLILREVIGQDDFAFFPAEMAKQFYADEEQLFQSGLPLIDHEERSLGPDGQPIWVSTTKVPLHNLNGELIGLVGISRDITEHKQREQQLRYYASLQESVTDAVITADMEFRIQSWNRAAETIYGWRAAEVIGGRVADYMATQYTSAEENSENAVRALFEHGQWQGEVIQRRKDGTQLYILSAVTLLKDDQGTRFGVVSVNHDITELKRVAEALREQRDFLQLVINSVPDLITVNDNTGRFQMVNERAAQIYGLTSAQMIGKTDAEVNPNPGEVAYFLQTDHETLDSGQMVFIPEQTILGRYYQTSKIPLKNQSGQLDRLLAVSFDITERKQSEQALQQALHKEKELGELKSRFFSMASHEFRTPLTSILLLLETLQFYRRKLTEQQIEQRLGRIQEQVNHLKAVMEDVLQLARLQAHRAALNRISLDLDVLCRSVIDELQSQPGGPHQLSYTFDDTLGRVELDQKLMRQIITNLVSNAIKYSPIDKPIFVRFTFADPALVFQVQDEGIGIPEADLLHLFEPFHRANNVGTISGTGLGLTIAKEAVELHGGTITVESLVDVGTTFTVRIPLLTRGEKSNDENPGN